MHSFKDEKEKARHRLECRAGKAHSDASIHRSSVLATGATRPFGSTRYRREDGLIDQGGSKPQAGIEDGRGVQCEEGVCMFTIDLCVKRARVNLSHHHPNS